MFVSTKGSGPKFVESDLDTYLRRKKRKTSLRDVGLLSDSSKKKTVKSDTAKLLEALIKERTQVASSVTEKLQKMGYKTEEEISKHYAELVKMSLGNDIGRINLIPNLVNNAPKVSFLIDLQTDIITSEWLYWSVVADQNESLDKEILKFLKLKSVYVITKEAMQLGNELDTKAIDMEEYYAQDFSADIYCTRFIKEKFVAAAVNQNTGTIGGGTEDYLIIQNKTEPQYFILAKKSVYPNLDKCIEQLDKTVYLSSKGILKKNIREIKKQPGYYYYQGFIELTNFCPPTLYLQKQRNFTVLLNYEMDVNQVVNSLVNGKMVLPKDSISFEDLGSFVEIAGVIGLTSNQTEFLNLYKSYSENRKVFSVIRQHFLLFKRVILLYLDSFTKGINIDRVRNINLLAKKYIENNTTLLMIPNYAKIVNEFMGYTQNYCERAYTFLNNDLKVLSAIKLIESVTSDILDPNATDLDTKVRSVAYECYKFLYNGETPIINEIRSPNTFLTNLLGDNKKDALEDILKKLQDKIQQSKDIEKTKLIEMQKAEQKVMQEFINLSNRFTDLSNRLTNKSHLTHYQDVMNNVTMTLEQKKNEIDQLENIVKAEEQIAAQQQQLIAQQTLLNAGSVS